MRACFPRQTKHGSDPRMARQLLKREGDAAQCQTGGFFREFRMMHERLILMNILARFVLGSADQCITLDEGYGALARYLLCVRLRGAPAKRS